MRAWPSRRARAGLILALVASLGLAACEGPSKPPPGKEAPLRLEKSSFAALEGWAEDDHAAALQAFKRSCRRIVNLPDDRPMGRTVGGTAAQWKPACQAAAEPKADSDARGFFERAFVPHRVLAGDEPVGLFTGYYEPELDASLTPDATHTTPLHARPSDLITVDLGRFRDAWKGERIVGLVTEGQLVPYHDRAAINAGALDGKAEALAWVADPVDAFFLEIQGSGRLLLTDGSKRRLGYEVANGRAYVAIGKVLLDEGMLEKGKVSMQSIRAWLAANPERARAVMERNPSYVFFAWRDKGDAEAGPIGAEGVALTAGRSLAVDRKLLPFGAPLWLETEAPLPSSAETQAFRRLMIAQDTGGAITGPVRGDIFFGTGDQAGDIAGRQNAKGRYFLLLPRGVEPRS